MFVCVCALTRVCVRAQVVITDNDEDDEAFGGEEVQPSFLSESMKERARTVFTSMETVTDTLASELRYSL